MSGSKDRIVSDSKVLRFGPPMFGVGVLLSIAGKATEQTDLIVMASVLTGLGIAFWLVGLLEQRLIEIREVLIMGQRK